ncbi:MAG: isovaleryl-CoA dehydrogenase [Hyphomicrobiales bacterium]
MTGIPFETHEVFNQSPPFAGANLYASDPVLASAVKAAAGGGFDDGLLLHGAYWGSADAFELGRLANVHSPVLRSFDAKGRRSDTVEFHPAWHALMTRSAAAGLHGSTREEGEAEAGHRNLLRAARFFMTAQAECGHLCPMTMTNAAAAALAHAPALAGAWLPAIRRRAYDGTFRPAAEKGGVTLGMGMTEKQGGTDVRANTSTAAPTGEAGVFAITGHKWFLSAPMSDAFLVLAQAPGGLSCFLLPRFLPDGRVNAIRLMRLKDKLGNRSNASSEVEFQGALAHLVGDEGRGIATILEMVTLTRLDCAVASAGLMRVALAEAANHARHRTVFQKKLADQPMMTRVLADMALDAAAATALSLRLAEAFDRAGNDPAEAAFARLMTPAVKYWVCKATPPLVYEAMECLGGNGYVEESTLPRLYREAPVNAIWEGSGNVMALDVIRALSRDRSGLDAVAAEIAARLGGGAQSSVDVLRAAADLALADEGSARFFVEQLALTVAGAALARLAPGLVAEAFLGSRLGGRWRATYGMLDMRYDARRILDQICPEA